MSGWITFGLTNSGLGFSYYAPKVLLIGVVFVALIALSRKVFGKRAAKAVRWRETLVKISFGCIMVVFGWLAARVHLHIFDAMFLRLGSLSYLKRKRDS